MSNNNHQITLQEAIGLTTAYRNNRLPDFFICETYEANAIRQLLSVPGCASLRIYLGRKEDNTVVTLLVAADANDADILPAGTTTGSEAATTGGGGLVLEDGYRCPEFCPPSSVLNT